MTVASDSRSMDIYARPGSKVVFAFPNAGYDPDRKQAARLLTLGAKYTVKCTYVDRAHTDVVIEEFPGEKFNSVLFRDA